MATSEFCTAALSLDVDPIGLVRRPGGAAGAAQEYVNGRPYVASSFLSFAISRVFGSAMAGRSSDRPELTETALPLVAKLGVMQCRGGEVLLRRLFAPLGDGIDYSIAALLRRSDGIARFERPRGHHGFRIAWWLFRRSTSFCGQ